jgi:hypothetical protein
MGQLVMNSNNTQKHDSELWETNKNKQEESEKNENKAKKNKER